ncbi:MAG: sensor histidine kinase [Alphaproteobacteria bacterium]
MAVLFTLLLGVSVAIVSHVMFDSGHATIAGIIVIVLMSLVVLVSFIISHFVVNRINTIAQTARDIIDTGDLSQRIQINTKWDDLSNLAQLLNHFLDRNEALMDGIREVSNNIAHDLRTPLTHLRNQIEDMKSRDVNENDMEDLLTEADQILVVFNSLLRISNIEKGTRYQAFEEVDLHALLGDVVELFEPVAEEKNIQVLHKKSSDITINGDRHLLFQMFANIVSNSIKFSPVGSDVIISATPSEVIIADRGTGIADAEKELVFRRFYRSDASRSTEGNGLGLSLAKAIIDLHQGSIALEDNHPGLRVRVKL